MAQSAINDIRQALRNPATIFGSSSSSPNPAAGQLAAAAAAPDSSSICSAVIDIPTIVEPPERAFGDGGGIVLVAQTSTGCLLGSTALAERGVTAEAVGAIAARDLVEALTSGAAVDHWMQDQLIVFMALAEGTSSMLCSELTLHTRTAISIMEQLIPDVKFHITLARSNESAETPLYNVRCRGVGLHRRFREVK
eukprot:GHUV01014983.1.p1 GENE.GHUV01014983.1~~GHUV01014983.1.p1  ORF type:complete len:195 (+),score=41.47 GHUV01014983.1:283-867(+)